MKGGSVAPLVILFVACAVFTVFIGLPIIAFFGGIAYALFSSM